MTTPILRAAATAGAALAGIAVILTTATAVASIAPLDQPHPPTAYIAVDGLTPDSPAVLAPNGTIRVRVTTAGDPIRVRATAPSGASGPATTVTSGPRTIDLPLPPGTPACAPIEITADPPLAGTVRVLVARTQASPCLTVPQVRLFDRLDLPDDPAPVDLKALLRYLEGSVDGVQQKLDELPSDYLRCLVAGTPARVQTCLDALPS